MVFQSRKVGNQLNQVIRFKLFFKPAVCSILMKIRPQSHRLRYVLVTIWQPLVTREKL